MLHTTKVKQQLVVSPRPTTSDTWPTFDQNQFTSNYNLNSQQNFQHNFNSSWANNTGSTSTFNTSNLTSNSTNHHHPHSSTTHSSNHSSFSTNHSASYLEKQILLKQTRELLLEKQQKLNNSICSSVGHEESSSTSLSSTCFTISGEESGENCKNGVNDCMEDDDDANFSPVLSPGRKRNYTPNVDGFSKKDTAQVTAQTSLLELPTKIPAPIPPPNSPSLMVNNHRFQNSAISATDG